MKNPQFDYSFDTLSRFYRNVAKIRGIMLHDLTTTKIGQAILNNDVSMFVERLDSYENDFSELYGLLHSLKKWNLMIKCACRFNISSNHSITLHRAIEHCILLGNLNFDDMLVLMGRVNFFCFPYQHQKNASCLGADILNFYYKSGENSKVIALASQQYPATYINLIDMVHTDNNGLLMFIAQNDTLRFFEALFDRDTLSVPVMDRIKTLFAQLSLDKKNIVRNDEQLWIKAFKAGSLELWQLIEHFEIREYFGMHYHVEQALWEQKWTPVQCWLKRNSNTQTTERLSPILFKALDENRLDMITFLLEQGSFTNKTLTSLLFKALLKNRLNIASFLLERCTISIDDYPIVRILLNRQLFENEASLIVILITFATLNFTEKDTTNINRVKAVDIPFVLLLTLERLIYYKNPALGRTVLQVAADIRLNSATLSAMRYLYQLIKYGRPPAITKTFLLELYSNMLNENIKSSFLTELAYFIALTGALHSLPAEVINTYLVPKINAYKAENNKFDFFGQIIVTILKQSLTILSMESSETLSPIKLNRSREIILQKINAHILATLASTTDTRTVALDALGLAIRHAPQCETRDQLSAVIAFWKKAPSLMNGKNNEMALQTADIDARFFSRLPRPSDRGFITELIKNTVFLTPSPPKVTRHPHESPHFPVRK